MFETNDMSGATFSDCKRYRYALWRMWEISKPKIMFVGLNPSRATQSKNDNTITKVSKIAFNNGYGGLYMMNLFGWISPYPEELKSVPDVLGETNKYLSLTREKVRDVCFCWGNFKEAEERAKEVIAMFPDAYCLVRNKNGTPKHPLYCKDETKLIKYNPTKPF